MFTSLMERSKIDLFIQSIYLPFTGNKKIKFILTQILAFGTFLGCLKFWPLSAQSSYKKRFLKNSRALFTTFLLYRNPSISSKKIPKINFYMRSLGSFLKYKKPMINETQ